jgi:hypothetical protein
MELAVPGIPSWARVNAAAIRCLDFWHKFGTVGSEIQRSQAKAGDTNYLILQDSGERRPEVVALRRQRSDVRIVSGAPIIHTKPLRSAGNCGPSCGSCRCCFSGSSDCIVALLNAAGLSPNNFGFVSLDAHQGRDTAIIEPPSPARSIGMAVNQTIQTRDFGFVLPK